MSTQAGENKTSSNTTVYVTGYGPFADIKINPSATVAKRVTEGLELRDDVAAVHYTELETSVAAASAYFDDLEQTIDKALAAQPNHRFLLFHVGVHSRETNGVMRVETRAFNELDASVPDVRGVAFHHQVINKDDGDTSVSLDTAFAHGPQRLAQLTAIVEKLNAANKARQEMHGLTPDPFASNSLPRRTAPLSSQGGDTGGEPVSMVMPEFQTPSWVVSTDAGRYLCNYCLYRSLKLQAKYAAVGQKEGDAHDTTSLKVPAVSGIFIHVCDPQNGQREGGSDSAHGEGKMAVYNPTIMEQSQQTEGVAQELVDWVIRA